MPKVFPTHIQIQTTVHCGAACAICPHAEKFPQWPNGLMSDGLFDRIVNQLSERRIECISPYLMADPLSDRKIFDRIDKLHRALPSTRIEVSTTGMYLHPKLARALLSAPLDELRISSHGITAEEYAATMPGVDFEQAMANILRFIEGWKRQRPFELSVVCLWGLWPANREREIEAFWKGHGVDLSKWRVVSRARQVTPTVSENATTDPTPYREGKKGPPYMCRFNRDTEWMHILSDGRVALCCMDYAQEIILGDATLDTLDEIWTGDSYREIREKVKTGLPDDPDFLCNRCEWHVSESVQAEARRSSSSVKAHAGATV